MDHSTMGLGQTEPRILGDGGHAAYASLDAFAISPGAIGWVHDYRSGSRTKPATRVSSGLRVTVQLGGHWRHEGRWGGAHRVDAGDSLFVSPGERYSEDALSDDPGLQIGFLLLSEQHPILRDASDDLRWAIGSRVDPTLVDLGWYVHEARRAGRVPDPSALETTLAALVARNCETFPTDGVALARREIDRSFHNQLYVRHFAEIAGLGEATFTRRFVARFGLSPTRYRLLLRVSAAARLLALGAGSPCAEISRKVGFEDESFFFRTFRSVVGITPRGYAARAQAGERSAAAGSGLVPC